MHYGLVIVAAGSLGIFACIGLARFAIGMLLPAMGQGLGLTYGQMGLLSTANFLGYLAGIVATAPLARRWGARLLITVALLLAGLAMVGVGCADGLVWIIGLYTVTGVGSALANIPIMAMLSSWFTSRLRAKAAGFVVSGNGGAIVLAGMAIPWLNGLTPHGWRLSWVVLGILVSLIALICGLVLRNRPEELGLAPMGEALRAGTIPQQRGNRHAPSTGLILHCGAIYFVFGFTFVAYSTFIVTAMVSQYDFSQEIAGSFWSWVGVLSLGSGPLFGLLADRVSRRFSLMLVLTFQTLAYLLAGLELSVVTLSLSIGCFGIVAWSIPSIMAALAGDYAGPEKAVAMFGALTFIFALGQVSGPVVAGLLAELTGGFAASFLLSSGMTALAAILAVLLPKPADGANV